MIGGIQTAPSVVPMRAERPPAVLLVAFMAAGVDVDAADYGADETGERKPSHTLVPVYPERARRERLEGDVQVCFNVDRTGKTHRVRVRTSSHRIFERPAVLAVRSSRYEPLPDAEVPAGIKMCRTFRFRLNPVAAES
jgi:TonB family protein